MIIAAQPLQSTSRKLKMPTSNVGIALTEMLSYNGFVNIRKKELPISIGVGVNRSQNILLGENSKGIWWIYFWVKIIKL